MTLAYDPKVPVRLRDMQDWFAGVITQPIDHESRIDPVAPNGTPIQEDAARFIVASPTLEPWQRIELYNQQYWWRLISVLQENFPHTLRLFGYHDFNCKIAIPYLIKHPPCHWSVDQAGNHLPQWVHEHYTDDDKPLVEEVAMIDHAFASAFACGEYMPINRLNVTKQGDFSPLLTQKVFLQPHLHLFKLRYDLLPFRKVMVDQTTEHWEANDFPLLGKTGPYHIAIYRTENNLISWKPIAAGEYALLQRFRNGSTIEKACQWLEKQDETLYNEAVEHLHIWFQEWTIRHWLGIP